MVKLNNKILKFNIQIIFFLISFFVFSCTASPRYTSTKGDTYQTKTSKNNNKISPYVKKSTKKQKLDYNPNKKIYKGVSSYYGKDFHGKLTANGEVYDMYGVTAAHKTFPLNTVARVTNLKNGKSLYIRINDRGPYIDGRILDCSYGAAKKLDFLNDGTTEVEIRIIEWGDNEYMHHK